MVQGKFGLWKPSMSTAANAVGASYGYVNTACRLSEAERRDIEDGCALVEVLQYVDQVGIGRLLWLVNNR